jgi:uncharacterized membrane protein/protein-disulfide isomerase
MTPRTRLVLAGFAALGLAASSASAFVHYRLLKDPRYTSVCDISSTVSCTEAYLSPYGSLFGVPVALLGVLWFAAVLGLLAWPAGGRDRRLAENVPGYVFALSTVGLGMVLYLAYGAFVALKVVCLFCVLTYVAVAGLFIVSGARTSFPLTSLPMRLIGDLRAIARRPVALAAIGIFLAAAGSAIAFFPKDTAPAPAPAASGAAAGAAAPAPAAALQQDQRSEVERWFDSQPRAIVPVDGGGAAVVIVKFNDYQCPPCGQTYRTYKPILAKYQAEAPGKVRFVSKDYPIDPECNRNTPGGSHFAACEAAVAVRLAREHNRAEALEDWLFANQPMLTPEAVRQAAREIGGVTDFDARYGAVLEQVRADIALGGLLGVRATPTFFINGVRVEGGLQAPYFDAIIAHELKKAGR